MARVLVIDDSPTVVAFMRKALAGHEVRALASYVDLPSELRRFPPAVVFLDLEMPALDGEKVGTFLRKFEARRTRLVIYSSRPRAELDKVGALLEADAVLEKGSDGDALRLLVKTLISGEDAEQGASAEQRR